jgi:hypothetical protein
LEHLPNSLKKVRARRFLESVDFDEEEPAADREYD